MKDKLARPRVDGERGDIVDDREGQNHLVRFRHASPHVADDVAADPDLADPQHRRGAEGAIGHPELAWLFPCAVAVADKPDGDPFGDQAAPARACSSSY